MTDCFCLWRDLNLRGLDEIKISIFSKRFGNAFSQLEWVSSEMKSCHKFLFFSSKWRLHLRFVPAFFAYIFYSVSKQNFLSRRWDLHLRFRVAFLWNAMTTTASKLIWSGALPVSSSNLMYLIVCYQVQNLQADVLSECPVDLDPIS